MVKKNWESFFPPATVFPIFTPPFSLKLLLCCNPKGMTCNEILLYTAFGAFGQMFFKKSGL